MPRRWSFGLAVLDERTLELTVNGNAVSLERKPLELLLYLLRHAGEVVTKDQILEAVWPGRILSESVLTKCVAKLREALRDENQELIRTQHGFGYRLFVPVTFAPSGGAEPAAAQVAVKVATRTLKRGGWLLAAGLGAVAVGLWVWTLSRGPGDARGADKSVAVLPFENLSTDPENRYFTEGLHDTVLTQLAHIRDLRIISRTSVLQYRDKQRNLRQIAQELGVAHVVEGSVQRAGDRLRVHAQLIHAATDTHIWAALYDRQVSDVFAIQAEVAQHIARAVQARLTPEEKTRIEHKPTENLDAYQLYLRALDLDRRSDAAVLPDLILLLEQAVSLDPTFAQAHALLSQKHAIQYWYGFDASPGRLARARESAETAVRLDPDLAEAHVARALPLYHAQRSYAEAIRELERARHLAPGDASVHFWLGIIYRRQARWAESVAATERALQLDPRQEGYLFAHGDTLAALRRHAEAGKVYARLVTFSSQPHWVQARMARLQLVWKGLPETLPEFPSGPDPGCGLQRTLWEFHLLRREFNEAAAAILACPDEVVSMGSAQTVPRDFLAGWSYHYGRDAQRAQQYYRSARGRLEASLKERPDQPSVRLALAFVLAGLGDAAAATREMDGALASMPLSRDALDGAELLVQGARLHAWVGAQERALDELERALTLPYGEHAHLAELHPAYDPIRNHPRFKKLIAEHLPKP